MIGFFGKGERAIQVRTGLLISHESFSSFVWPMKRGVDPCSVAIIGFGKIGLYIAYHYLKEGYSVCVYDLESDVTRVQQIMEAELPKMLNTFMFASSPALLRSSHSGDAQKVHRCGRSQLIGEQRVQSSI